MTSLTSDDDLNVLDLLDELTPDDDELLIRPEDFDDEFPLDVLAA